MRVCRLCGRVVPGLRSVLCVACSRRRRVQTPQANAAEDMAAHVWRSLWCQRAPRPETIRLCHTCGQRYQLKQTAAKYCSALCRTAARKEQLSRRLERAA